MSDQYMTTTELAKRLRMRPQTIRLWRMRGCGPKYHRLGEAPSGRVVYSDRDVEEWLKSHRWASTAAEAAELPESGTP